MKNSTYVHLSILLLSLLTSVCQLMATSNKVYLQNSSNGSKLNNEFLNNPKKKNNTKNLSLELLSFEAIKNGNRVEIYWSTKSESSNKYYTLERSRNGVDFETVSVIDAANINTDAIQYVETDFQPLSGISYYRLKSTSLNNKNTYSQVVMVNYIYDKSNINLYSNSSTGNFKFSLKKFENTEVLVVLRDFDGREYYSKVLLVLEDSEIIGIDSENKLSSGTYIVTATSNNLLYNQKLIVR